MVHEEPSKLRNLLIEFVTSMRLVEYCDSLYLVGSYSSGDVLISSDIDIIIIVRNDDAIRTVSKIFEEFRSQIEPMLDIRVYTRDSFNKANNGLDHFSIWSNIQSGLLIIGSPIAVKLKPNLVKAGLLHWIDRIDESICHLEVHTQFEGTCFLLYSALVWFFFIDKHLIHEYKGKISKVGALRNVFGDMQETISLNYEKTLQKIRKKKINQGEKIRFKETRRWSEVEYSMLLGIAEDVNEYGNEILLKVSNRYGV